VFLYLVSAVRPFGFGWLADIPFQLHPLLFLLISAVLLSWQQYKSKFWLLRTLGRIVAAPWIHVIFRDFYLADQLNSIVIVLQDMEYTVCFFLSDAWTGQDVCDAANVWMKSIIAILPGLWRFLQCLRRYRDSKDWWQLVNAGKYSTGFFVVITSLLHSVFPNDSGFLVLWILSILTSTCYTYTWDIKKDWGLGMRSNQYLRPRLLYRNKKFYYAAMVANLIMRFMWTLTISPQAMGIIINPILFATILAGVEIVRRALWNLFRLENEQLSNVGKFRAINLSLPAPPVKPQIH